MEIEKIENGFVLTHEEEIDDDKFRTVKEVIEDNDDDEKETMKRLLKRVAEYFGIQYDKFAKDNLNISWNKKGHKL